MNDEDCGENLARLKEACQPLYPCAHSTKLADTMLLMNIRTIHGVNNKFVDELLSLLHKHLLPPDNCLPSNTYHVKVLIRKLSFNYKIIHACPNRCVSFQGVYANLGTCPNCGSTRYKDVGQAKVLIKVFHHFPLIPWLKHMFRTPIISNLMVWHNGNKSIDGLVRHVAYSKAWVHIDVMWPKFAIEPHYLQLGLATNGVNPFGAQGSSLVYLANHV